jgi:hypothetical protein
MLSVLSGFQAVGVWAVAQGSEISLARVRVQKNFQHHTCRVSSVEPGTYAKLWQPDEQTSVDSFVKTWFK